MDATGINVDAFFDQWIHRGGEPKFRVNYFETIEIKFIVEQIHEKDEVVRDFEIPVDMAVYYKDGHDSTVHEKHSKIKHRILHFR